MDAEDLLRESEGAYDGDDGDKVEKGESEDSHALKNGADGKGRPEHAPKENRDFIDISRDKKVKTKENGVIEVRDAGKGGLKPVPKSEITSLDLHFLVKELRQRIRGAVFRKIYQYGGRDTKQMLFGFFMPGAPSRDKEGGESGKQLLMYIDNKKLFLTAKKEPAPQDPSSFCMFLRKHLMGKRVKDIIQHGFDRIIELHTQENILIFELFSKGNVIICDSSYSIIMPMEIQKWRHREIRPKVQYRFPPSQLNPFLLGSGKFYQAIANSQKNLIATLATGMSLGPAYAKEVCKRAGVEGEKAAHSVTAAEASNLQAALLELERSPAKPMIYPGIVSPFPLQSAAGDSTGVESGSFSDALDSFFSIQMFEVKKEVARKVVEKKVKKVERIAEKQAEASEKWTRIAGESKGIADTIYNHYTIVEAVISGIRKGKDSGMSWSEIKQNVSSESTPEADSVKEIREGDGIVVVELDGKEVEIDFTKSVEDNAARYFDDAKWAKSKIRGADAALEQTEKKLEATKVLVADNDSDGAEAANAIVIDSPESESVEKPAEPKKIKKRWYEYYRWFVSSDGLVVIAGKNAQQNENIIKKRLEPGDLIFHSDIQGAAFVIIKSGGKPIPQETIRQASEFSAAHSKAWAKGLGKVDVFAAKPGQVSKANEQGVNAPKGAFFISGERMWFRDVPIKLAIGLWINREENWAKVIAGPLMPVRKLAKYFVTLRPGFTRPPELAANIKRNLMMKAATPDDKFFIEKVSLEDFQGQIPSGQSDMIEGAGDF
jgi:predicted ribosome quality control (RQC) complex YloA/Tae2 family protein